jgi:hypothetical protein
MIVLESETRTPTGNLVKSSVLMAHSQVLGLSPALSVLIGKQAFRLGPAPREV